MGLTAFIEYPSHSHYPIENLPFGVCRFGPTLPRCATAIGAYVVDLSTLEVEGLLDTDYFGQPTLNAFMAVGRSEWQRVRARLQHLLSAQIPDLRDNHALRARVFHRMEDVEMVMPAAIGDYTDFYASRQHATNVGTMFRGAERALPPNWLHLPIAYHGRASSVVVSGTPLHRPRGQMLLPGAQVPTFGPTQKLDFELELGAFIGPGNALGEPIPVGQAADHVFGFVLVNDWSARDIQRWEYAPLGPFNAKNLGTSISPWIVTLDALEPCRVPGPEQSPQPLPYLQSADSWHFDIQLEVAIQSSQMTQPQTIARSNARHLYWSFAQMIAHHSITGCNLRPGDLLASGTISGDDPASFGSLLELTWNGEHPLTLADGSTRAFLEDGDIVTMTAYAQGDGYRIGLGSVSGRIMPPV